MCFVLECMLYTVFRVHDDSIFMKLPNTMHRAMVAAISSLSLATYQADSSRCKRAVWNQYFASDCAEIFPLWDQFSVLKHGLQTGEKSEAAWQVLICVCDNAEVLVGIFEKDGSFMYYRMSSP